MFGRRGLRLKLAGKKFGKLTAVESTQGDGTLRRSDCRRIESWPTRLAAKCHGLDKCHQARRKSRRSDFWRRWWRIKNASQSTAVNRDASESWPGTTPAPWITATRSDTSNSADYSASRWKKRLDQIIQKRSALLNRDWRLRTCAHVKPHALFPNRKNRIVLWIIKIDSASLALIAQTFDVDIENRWRFGFDDHACAAFFSTGTSTPRPLPSPLRPRMSGVGSGFRASRNGLGSS